jgi:hypothetical protein
VPAGQDSQAVKAALFDLPATQLAQLSMVPVVEGLTLPVSQKAH